MSHDNSVRIAFLMLATMFSAVAIMFYFWFGEMSPLTFKNLPFPPTITTVETGSIVPLKVIRCNTSKHTVNYSTTHSLLNLDNHQQVSLPDARIIAIPGCNESLSLINKVPDETPLGRYIVIGTAAIPGTMRYFQTDWYSSEFRVVEKTVPVPLIVLPYMK